MNVNDYLEAVLDEQTLADGSEELEALRTRGNEVKELLRRKFSKHGPRVSNAGSYEKGTMVRLSYDFDVLCYFPSDTSVGGNLEEVYDAVEDVLRTEYTVQRKRSALRLLDANGHGDPVYFNVDVVPGRFVDGKNGDVFLHQTEGDKQRLKTNPEVQIDHVRRSGVRKAIKLAKVWRERYGFKLPTFVLELLVIGILNGLEGEDLADQLVAFWKELRDNAQNLSVSDPANSNNDLSTILDSAAKLNLETAATWALQLVEDEDWKAIFGEVQERAEERAERLASIAVGIRKPSRPWYGADSLA